MQYHLHFAASPSYREDDWISSPSNHEASEWVLQPERWNSYGFLLVGPHASGKTHLAQRFAQHFHAAIIDSRALKEAAPSTVLQGRTHVVLEDIHHLAPATLLFALQAAQLQNGSHLLMTSQHPTQEMLHLPADIASRLEALPKAIIKAPDTFLLEALLRKQLQDAQLTIPESTLAYLLPRLERSYASIDACSQWLINCAQGQAQRLSVPFIKAAAADFCPNGLDINAN